MDRRAFMKASAGGAGALLGAARNSSVAEAGRKTNSGEIKNVLFLFVDQQRQDCLGCYGNEIVQTPNIDRLAANGIMFNNAYTPTPLCSPARMSLQTGLWAHNSRVMFNTGQGGLAGGMDDPAPGTGFFSDSLNDKGWQTAHVGKWHLGSEINKPSDHSYEGVYYTGYGLPSGIYSDKNAHYTEYLKSLGLNGFNLLSEKRDPSGKKLYSGMQEGPSKASVPTYLANQTIDYINDYSQSDDSFFISCNFWGPHEPYCIPKEYYEMYDAADIEVWPNFDCDLSDKPSAIRRYGDYWKTGWLNRKNLAQLIAEYFGYISLIDYEIGRIMKALEESGELDSTLIVYSADHGSTVGSYRMWAKGFGMYDVVTRIPMILSHPSIKPAESDAFTTLLDLAPTFLDTAGIQASGQLDGESLKPMIRGEKNSVRDDFIVTEAFGHVVPLWQRMVRTEHSKYIYTFTAEDEFYDLDNDQHETRNIIGSVDKRTLKRHREMLVAEMERNTDPLLYWAQSTILD